MSNNPIQGLGYFFRGLGLITRPGIRPYVLIPLAINTAIFVVLIWWGALQIGDLMDMLSARLPGWLDWLAFLLIPLFALTAGLFLVFGFSILANLIAAPFNGVLAEAVERKLTGRPMPEQSAAAIMKDLVGSIASEIGKLIYFALLAIPFLILFLIPGLNIIAPFTWMLFGAWMLALEYGDFPMGNHGIRFGEQRRIAAGKRLTALGFGATVMLVLMIPVVNFLVIPAAVAGATAMWVREFAPGRDSD